MQHVLVAEEELAWISRLVASELGRCCFLVPNVGDPATTIAYQKFDSLPTLLGIYAPAVARVEAEEYQASIGRVLGMYTQVGCTY